MKNYTRFSIPKLYILIGFLIPFALTAQNEDSIIKQYNDYAEDAREVIYLHINKSTYIKGESIGFTAYVFDKKDKKPSQITTNLYVSVEDESKNIIKQKLLKVENGVSANVIEIDSSFTSGHYTIKAYTNWMRNFDEQNYFVESVRIIDPKTEKFIETKSIENTIDAQFLPEGGHLLNNIVNNVGVILKDTKGYGIPYVKATVTDKDDILISEFQVNHLGIGKFPLLADVDNNYKINFSYLNKDFSFQLNKKVEPIGITLSIVSHRNKAIVEIITNNETLEQIKNTPYKLTLHNGDKIDAIPINFNEELSIIRAFKLDEIPTGVNVFTLFNQDNTPITERLFFNYNGIDIKKSGSIATTKAKDSITMTLNFKQINQNAFNNVSVSVLPQETNSYNKHHNIISYTYLQPYVNGTIEDAKYYFTDITLEKQLELDNLLITQGWSSYDWSKIFEPNKGLNYTFEKGITLKANINSNTEISQSTYMLHTTSVKEPHFFKVENLELNHFFIDNLFPYQSERLYLSSFDKKDAIQLPKLYLQAIPNKIPQFLSSRPILKPKANYNLEVTLKKYVQQFKALNSTQNLDEVVVNADVDKKTLRMKELIKSIPGRVVIIDENEVKQHMFLSRFLTMNGYRIITKPTDPNVIVKYYSTQKIPPAIFVDDFQLIEKNYYLLNYSLDEIDYIIMDRTTQYGRNEGTLKIYTYPGSRADDSRKRKLEFKFPLAFESKKTFYVPKYRYYNDDFYKGYGTIDWKPELVTDANGNITVKIAQPEVPITLFIEGIANDGSFIFEEKTISLN